MHIMQFGNFNVLVETKYPTRKVLDAEEFDDCLINIVYVNPGLTYMPRIYTHIRAYANIHTCTHIYIYIYIYIYIIHYAFAKFLYY